MKITASSGNLDIIDSRTVYLTDVQSDLTLNFNESTGGNISLEIRFVNDHSNEYTVKRSVDGNKISYECVNFADNGTGTIEPIELATFGEKQMYIMFWSFLQGDAKGKKRVRKVDYTLFLER